MADFLITFLLILVLIGMGLFLLLCAYMLRRNHQVCKFRMELIDWIHLATVSDDMYRVDWDWRYRAFNAVSYERMLHSFKPLKAENFYEDTSFLEVTP